MINPFTGLEEDDLGMPIESVDRMPASVPEVAPVSAPTVDPIEYIKQKYGLSDRFSDQARQKAIEGSQLTGEDKFSSALMALGAGISGRDPAAAAAARLKDISGQRAQGLEQFDKGRAGAIANIGLDRDISKMGREDKEFADKQAKLKREMDPSSEESKMAQDLAKAMGYQGDTTKMTAAQFQAFSPALQKKYEIAQKSLDRQETAKAQAAAREDARSLRREMQEERLQTKREREDESDVQKLSKDVKGTQEMLGALDEVEQKLGGRLEDFSRDESGNLMKGGKPVDLPGISVPGYGRVTAFSSSARELQGAADRVFNATLKDRSGGAVTDNELDRLKREFNQGKYNTEPELIDALQRYKRQTALVLKNREAGYKPNIVETYKTQGGRTSGSLGTQFPEKQVEKQPEVPNRTVNGKTYKKVPGGWEEI